MSAIRIIIANGILFHSFPIIPANIPIKPQETICHIVHIPVPNIIFDRKVMSNARTIPLTGPRNNPLIIITEVTGWTLGMEANAIRPTTASVANSASNVIL